MSERKEEEAEAAEDAVKRQTAEAAEAEEQRHLRSTPLSTRDLQADLDHQREGDMEDGF